MKPKYNRILLKLSGESLAGDQKTGIDFDKVVEICKPIKKCVDAGVQVGIVVGGGNFWLRKPWKSWTWSLQAFMCHVSNRAADRRIQKPILML